MHVERTGAPSVTTTSFTTATPSADASPVLAEPAFSADGASIAFLTGREADAQIRSQGQRAADLTDRAADRRKACLEAQRRSAERKEEQGFWAGLSDDLGDVALVAGIAGAAFTGGTSLALAAAALAVASKASGGTLWLDEIGMNETAAKVTVSIANGVVGGSAAVGVGGGALLATSSTLQTAGTVAQVTQAGAQVGSSGAQLESDLHGARAAEEAASAALAGGDARAAKTEREEAVQMMENAVAMQERVRKLAMEADEARHRGASAAARA